MNRRRALVMLAAALTAGLTTACGVKGAPELPEEQEDSYPRKYPSGPPPS